MSANQARFRIATMARVLGVSPSGYYAWRGRPPSAHWQADAELTVRVEAIHVHSRGSYGAPRIHAELAAGGVAVSRKRVARGMRAAGMTGVSRRRAPRTTRRDSQVPPAPDRVERHFQADAANRLWVADITYVPTLDGFRRRPKHQRPTTILVEHDLPVDNPSLRVIDRNTVVIDVTKVRRRKPHLLQKHPPTVRRHFDRGYARVHRVDPPIFNLHTLRR